MRLKTQDSRLKSISQLFSFKFLCPVSCVLCLVLNGCSKDSNPAGSSEGLPYAVKVISENIGCIGINLYTDPKEALWNPNYRARLDLTAPLEVSYSGFVSLGPGGHIIIEMGVDVIDGPGADIAVYQAVSDEETGVYVADNLSSPFRFLGSQRCGFPCRFDLNGSGYTQIRYVMVQDQSFPTCYDTAGSDIDAVEALNYK